MTIYPTLDPILCPDDECYATDAPTSAAVTVRGRTYYLLAEGEPEAYFALKRQATVTHRIESLELCGGLYRCVMQGTDGSAITVHITPEDVYANLNKTEDMMGTHNVSMVC